MGSMLFFSLLSIGVVIVLVIVIVRNRQDKKDLTQTLNDNYKKPPKEGSEINDGEIKI